MPPRRTAARCAPPACAPLLLLALLLAYMTRLHRIIEDAAGAPAAGGMAGHLGGVERQGRYGAERCASLVKAVPCLGNVSVNIWLRVVERKAVWRPYRALAPEGIARSLALALPTLAAAALELAASRGDWQGAVFIQNGVASLVCSPLAWIAPRFLNSSLLPWNPIESPSESLSALALHESCQLGDGRIFELVSCPHFCGGRELFEQALLGLGWTSSSSYSSSPTLLVAPCMFLLPSMTTWMRAMERGVKLISAAPNERTHALKRPFNRAVARRLKGINCSADSLVPETHMVSVMDGCLEFVRRVRELGNGTRWFLKSRVESFGNGITVVDTIAGAIAAVANCSAPHRLDFIAQRGQANLVLIKGRATQGRAYLVVSSYAPLTAWFFDGYFNVASMKVDARNKEAHVTNVNSNQQSRRLTGEELLEQGFANVSERAIVRRRIREAFLQAFFGLLHWMERRPGSFSLFGIDFLVDQTMSVSLLESNCNCELFNDVEEFGEQRVNISVSLVKHMMDAVLATNSPESYSAFAPLVASGALSSLPLELLYTEATTPAWSLAPIDTCYPTV